ncbi:MAG TPA: hypothetical protein VM901_00625 [Bdellovibrionota bacterium]|jgi:hypothetical protein|nr:hypothetical protein [Bdellovibrionota bacterium]
MKRFIRDAVKYSSRWALILYDRDHPTRSLSVDGRRIKSLISLQSTFAALFVLIAVGWVYTRYRNFSLESEIRLKTLEMRALKDELAVTRRIEGDTTTKTEALTGAYSFFPGLQGGFTDGSVKVDSVRAELDPEKRELGLDFDIVRTSPREGRTDFYWFVVLSGPGYLYTFPQVMRLRNGDLVDFEAGQSLQNVSASRRVSARFQVPMAEIPKDLSTLNMTFFLYDLRGSLVISERITLGAPKGSLPKNSGRGG